MERLRVLIADDQLPFVRMLEALLDDEERVEVVGRALDGEQAVERALALAPDVVLMDITMPRLDGIQATRRLRESGFEGRVLMLTESDFRADAVRSERAGADGYVPKPAIHLRLRAAILAV